MPTKNRRLSGSETAATVGQWLAVAEKAFVKQDVALGQVAASAHDEALYLLLHALDLPLDSSAEVLERRLTPVERKRIEEMFARRIFDRVPAAYLTHEAWLGDLRFYVDERVIIPRSYFLELIPDGFARWLKNPTSVRRVADVCTGSGCLAILLATHYPTAEVDAIDLSPEALEVAAINVREHGLRKRVALHRSDMFASVPHAKYDLILSNPPYEPSRHVDAQAPEFKAEPRMAHDGGKDGLEIIRRLLQQAPERLTPRGIVAVEVGGLRSAISREFAKLKPVWLKTHDASNCVCLFEARNLPA